jgi:hypothetical protein
VDELCTDLWITFCSKLLDMFDPEASTLERLVNGSEGCREEAVLK